jgi:hypothetical protein
MTGSLYNLKTIAIPKAEIIEIIWKWEKKEYRPYINCYCADLSSNKLESTMVFICSLFYDGFQ